MKTTVLSVIIIFFTGLTLFAQEQSFKAQKGDITTQVDFSPFSSSPVRINQISMRFFGSNNKVTRLGISIGTEIESPIEDVTTSTFEIAIRPGTEKHFDGTERLSPYLGFEGELIAKFSRMKDESGSQDIVLKGAWDDYGTERGYYIIGVSGIAGADYYIAKRVYIGTEFGFGFQYTKTADITFERNGNEVGDPDKGGSAFQLGPNYNAALRLGFAF